mgnify:CR=1 FL=1
MAYDRYDTRDQSRDERSRWRDERDDFRSDRGGRGFFERAGDEIASWFGDDDADRRRRRDERMHEEFHTDETIRPYTPSAIAALGEAAGLRVESWAFDYAAISTGANFRFATAVLAPG